MAVDAVRVFWATYLEFAGRQGPFDAASAGAAFDRVSTGAARDRLLALLRANAAAGLVVRGSIGSDPRLVLRAGTVATVQDCYDDRSGLFQAAGGARLDGDDPRRHSATFGLVLHADGWKVTSIEQSEEPCAGS